MNHVVALAPAAKRRVAKARSISASPLPQAIAQPRWVGESTVKSAEEHLPIGSSCLSLEKCLRSRVEGALASARGTVANLNATGPKPAGVSSNDRECVVAL
jgi:hypothetical protein